MVTGLGRVDGNIQSRLVTSGAHYGSSHSAFSALSPVIWPAPRFSTRSAGSRSRG
jgi:hypothetical protein